MSMTMILYNCSDDNAVINKTLTGDLTVTPVPTAGISLDTPVIDIAYNAAALSKNYAKLSIVENNLTKYEAYYFVMPDKQLHIGDKITLSLQIDLLMTYKTGLLDSPVNVIRNAAAPTYVPDDKYPVEPDRFKLYTEPLAALPAAATGSYVVGVNTSNS